MHSSSPPILHAVIIDDEMASRKSLANLVEKYCEGIEITGMADGVESGHEAIQALEPDLVFLDIQLRDGTGFDLLERQRSASFQVIFTTAYNEYAIRAFKFSAIDYLLKPIDFEELENAVRRAVHQRRQYSKATISPIIERLRTFNHNNPTITIPTEETIEYLKVSDIVRLEAHSSYTILHVMDGKRIVSSKTLKTYEGLLNEFQFFRTHQSHLINTKRIRRYLRRENAIEMNDGSLIPLSRRRRDLFFQLDVS